MNTQFTPMDYDLNEEYRQRQTERSEHTRQVDEVNPDSDIFEQLVSANIVSAFLIIVSVITLLIFFTMGTGTSHAQSETGFTPGSDGQEGSEVHLYLSVAVAAIRADDFATANLLLEEALLVDPDFAALYISQSYIALLGENYEEALTLAETAVEITPDDTAIYFLLAEAQFGMEDYESAEISYEVYRDMILAQGHQPVLITFLLDEDSLPIVEAHLATCNEENDS